jgi:ribulose 1,5-bisphosphate synthetase/thiazole synthase
MGDFETASDILAIEAKSIAVIGAGPSGLTAAKYVSDGGLKRAG